MVLVDSSVWIGHLRAANPLLRDLLNDSLTLTHPFVIGELSCGSIKNRKRFLADLNELPSAISARHEEVTRLLDERELWSRGIGWIDMHLITSALLTGCQLWTLDASLRTAAMSAKVDCLTA
jgi:predicted nucleic acid-binding protein